jgi:cytochrome c oxidase subunit 1
MAAIVTIAAQAIFLFNFFWSLLGSQSSQRRNPWHATTLEWYLSSPIPSDNFGSRQPPVYRSAYMYGVRWAGLDFLPQHVAPESLTKLI